MYFRTVRTSMCACTPSTGPASGVRLRLPTVDDNAHAADYSSLRLLGEYVQPTSGRSPHNRRWRLARLDSTTPQTYSIVATYSVLYGVRTVYDFGETDPPLELAPWGAFYSPFNLHLKLAPSVSSTVGLWGVLVLYVCTRIRKSCPRASTA